jgi:hypothetical protein
MSKIVHWLIRVGDGKHLETSSKFGIWGVDSTDSNVKSFMGLCHGKCKKAPIQEGDILWFIKGGSGGLAMSCAKFTLFVKRNPGETMSNVQLGWDQSIGISNGKWDYEVRFTNYKEISEKILTNIKSPGVVRRYNELCQANLPVIYETFYTNSSNEMANEECSQIKQETIAISKPESDNELTHIYENIVDMKKSCLDMMRKMDILIELLSKKC